MDIIIFTIKATLFSMAYSFAAGLVVMLVALPFSAMLDKQKPSGVVNLAIGIPFMIVLVVVCAGQGAILASAVDSSLEAVSGRWKILWYWVGAFSSIPAALTQGARQMSSDESSAPETRISTILGPALFVVFAIWPSLIPRPLSSIATFLVVT